MSDKLAATQHGMTQPSSMTVELKDGGLFITTLDGKEVSIRPMTVIFDATHEEARVTYVHNSVMTTAKFQLGDTRFHSNQDWHPGFDLQ